jgi:CRISPR-associated protein Cas2
MRHAQTKGNFVVVAYDICDEKRLALVHRRMKRFGIGVQYSVFECLLNPTQMKELKKMINSTIKKKEGDRVRFYFLCESCRKRVHATDSIVKQDAPAIFV